MCLHHLALRDPMFQEVVMLDQIMCLERKMLERRYWMTRAILKKWIESGTVIGRRRGEGDFVRSLISADWDVEILSAIGMMHLYETRQRTGHVSPCALGVAAGVRPVVARPLLR